MSTEVTSYDSSPSQLTAQDFINIVTEVNREKYAKYYHKDESGYEEIEIINVEFIEDIIIDNQVIVNLPFAITNCTFNNNFLIRGGEFHHNFMIRGNTIYKKEFIIEGGDFYKFFLIVRGKFESNTFIRGGNFKSYFWIEKGVFDGSFSISGNTICKQFWINDGTFNHFNIASGSFTESFTIQGGNFNETFGISGGVFDSIFSITNGIFNKFLISGGRFVYGFSINGGIFKKELIIDDGYIYEVKLLSLTSPIYLEINNKCQINILTINKILPKESLIRISGKLSYIFFQNLQNFGTMILTETSFREKLFVPEGNKLPENKELPESPQLHIRNSDLGKTTLIACDLSGFELDFKSSKITDVFVAGTKMPNKIISNDPGFANYQQQQLGYSQIKKIYEARGDRVEANRYYAREMDAYLQTLSWRNHFWEKLNLGLNWFSTFYGQYWGQGLLSTLVVSGLFYGVYCWLLGFAPAWPITSEAWEEFGQLMSYFMEFINPIHKADYVAEELLGKSAHINGWARTTEGISRIFIAYFVYQLIQAFRKHGKASS